VCAEASTVLRDVPAKLFFNCWCLGIHSDNLIRGKGFDCKGSRIYMSEVEAVP
jgi:hypothetical protein